MARKIEEKTRCPAVVPILAALSIFISISMFANLCSEMEQIGRDFQGDSKKRVQFLGNCIRFNVVDT